MNPREVTEAEAIYWSDRDGGSDVARVVIGGPEEGPDVIPCPAVVSPEAGMIHVAYALDEIELAALAQGGTLWLTTWGPLPVHLLEVTS